ncbi:MAG: lipopolysaccharide heptosyltransferase family protein [Cytophagales bacterium]|nr:MAG: lipopolysaccharide heptosyltransferase family protein [Cytophagales bacterium]
MQKNTNSKLKILIIRFSSLGDIVLTTPVIRCIKTQLEGVELHYCTKEKYAMVLENNPYIDRLILLKDCLKSIYKELLKEQYDYVIDLHGSLRSHWLTWGGALVTYRFKKLNLLKWLYVNFKINRMPDKHIVDRYLDTVRPLGVFNDGKGLDYFISKQEEIKTEELPLPYQKGFVALSIGGGAQTKRLPFHKLVELCSQIKSPLLLIGGEEEQGEGEKIEQYFKKQKQYQVKNVCGKYNFNQSASLLKQAQLVITHDTGMMHIAAAFRKPIISIWGSTTPHLGMYPYQTPFSVIENKDLGCRPCSKIGFDNCPKGHFECMNSLNFEMIHKKISQLKIVNPAFELSVSTKSSSL